MIRLTAILAFLFLVAPFDVLASDWTAKSVRVQSGALLCDYFHMEKAMTLIRAEDRDSVAAFVEKGYCSVTPKALFATVTNDTSQYSNHPMVEITIKGESAWTAKGWAKCCYTNTAGEWEWSSEYGDSPSPQATSPAPPAGTDCAQAKRHVQELKGAGLARSAQYESWTEYIEENCE